MGDEDLAELTGVILGDGNVGIYTSKCRGKSRVQCRIKVTLNSISDIEYSQYVSRIMERVFGRRPCIWRRTDANALDLFIFGRKELDMLFGVGIKASPKWGRAVVPARFMQPPFDKLVVRGYVDTDGCISVVNNNGIRYPRIEMKISPAPMQAQLIAIMERAGLGPQVSSLERGKVRVCLAGMRKLRKWSETIGFSNPRNRRIAESFLGPALNQPYKSVARY